MKYIYKINYKYLYKHDFYDVKFYYNKNGKLYHTK